MKIDLTPYEQCLIETALIRDAARYADPKTADRATALARRISEIEPAEDGPEVEILSLHEHYARVHEVSIQEAEARLYTTTTRE